MRAGRQRLGRSVSTPIVRRAFSDHPMLHALGFVSHRWEPTGLTKTEADLKMDLTKPQGRKFCTTPDSRLNAGAIVPTMRRCDVPGCSCMAGFGAAVCVMRSACCVFLSLSDIRQVWARAPLHAA
jgi:hypothetical protein